MLKGLEVKNLRSFQNYAYSELKPLTVYLGRNSSGKSSLIRLFPLLRQSVQETTTGPILWYGRFVDYGNFNEAVCKNSDDIESITLKFDLSISHTNFFKSQIIKQKIFSSTTDVSVELNISEHEQKTFTRSISFEIDGSKVLISPSSNKDKTVVCASSQNFTYIVEAQPSSQIDFKFFPTLKWVSEGIKKTTKETVPWLAKDFNNDYLEYTGHNNQLANLRYHNKKTSEAAANAIKKFFHPNTNISTIALNIQNIRSHSRVGTERMLMAFFRSQNHFINKVKNPAVMNELLDILFPFILLKNYQPIINNINESLKKSFLSVKYLAPIRANSERFYRFQDLQVDEMDHTGSNIAMILNAFTEDEKFKFQEWTQNNFGFIAFVTADGSHYAIKIKTDNDTEEHNINDMGYGFSQVLPIIMSIWLEIHNPSNNDDEVIFVIEQPELHLHPAYQTKVANLFAKVVNSIHGTNRNIKFIFETHSQSMIDALGNCIQQKIISKDDVNIMIFEKNKDIGSTAFTAQFDDEGYFINWPVGFFSGE
ncbi:TPA: AAA family ATPase [Enterobacter roggenkampii]|nr:AAA family ATPase [Enterobacter roggenkampii]